MLSYIVRPVTGWDGPRTPELDRRSKWSFKAYQAARRLTHPDLNDGDRAAWDQVEGAARGLGLGGAR